MKAQGKEMQKKCAGEILRHQRKLEDEALKRIETKVFQIHRFFSLEFQNGHGPGPFSLLFVG